MSLQTTLLTGHKGVDLHAATALRVMRGRLDDGMSLAGLFRCEMHTYWDDAASGGADRLLRIGRYYNPNKHHFGVFELEDAAVPWFTTDGHELDTAWPGRVHDSDLDRDPDLYGRMLGGAPPAGTVAVDVVSFPRGESGPVLSGVLWRLVMTGDPAEAGELAAGLLVARGRKEGLLVNPHMEAWQLTVR